MTKLRLCAALALSFAAGSFVTSFATGRIQSVHAQSPRVFELRIYHAPPGKLEDLKTRFRDHTIDIFNRHGITSIGYWVPQDADKGHDNTLIYLIAHPSREEATKNWRAFGTDPEWQKVSKASEANGKIVDKIESTYMDPADFSPVK
jgi:hypothetical protein